MREDVKSAFRSLRSSSNIWIPYVVPPNQRLRDPARGAWYLQVIARLKPGVSLRQAQAQMTQMASAIEDANPVWNKNVTIGVRSRSRSRHCSRPPSRLVAPPALIPLSRCDLNDRGDSQRPAAFLAKTTQEEERQREQKKDSPPFSPPPV